jgi:hypothetical protein
VIIGEEEPGRDVAVFSSELDAQLYAQWRRAHELAQDDDDQDPGWENPSVPPAEFGARYWNSFDPAPASHSEEPKP